MEFPQEVPAPKEQHVNFSYPQAQMQGNRQLFWRYGIPVL